MSNATDLDIGMIGLGTMGLNLALNMIDHGYRVAGFTRDPARMASLRESTPDGFQAFIDLQAFVQALRAPRVVMLLVPAGAAVDSVIAELQSVLAPGDFIVDAGNSFHRDTTRRAAALAGQGLGFMGMGVSGGSSGARHGPSIMPGGEARDYERIRPILERVAARFEGEPCVALMGNGAAGHYVKMIHNGIEYALMQMLAECYDLMKRRLGMSNAEMAAEFARWDGGRLHSFLVGITVTVLQERDALGHGELVDAISDRAGSKGTGKWSSQEAMDLGVPVPAIDAAVSARELSAQRAERALAQARYPASVTPREDRGLALAQLEEACFCAAYLAYAQGLAQIEAASREYGFNCELAQVARVWRAGCIIRAAILEPIRAAFAADATLPNLLLDAAVSREIGATIGGLRATVIDAFGAGVPAPALAASLAWFDGWRTARLPANLIQAQRDLFGAHTYERLDREGTFHTQWGDS